MKKKFPEMLDFLQIKRGSSSSQEVDSATIQEILENVINSSPAVVFIWKEGKGWPVAFVSRNIEQFGYSVDEVLSDPMRYRDIMHPDDIENINAEVEAHLKAGESQFNLRYRILTKGREVRWVDERTTVHESDSGTYYQGIIVDITDQKNEERALLDGALEMKKALETVINSSPVIVFLWKAQKDWPVEFVSENISLFGYDVEDFISGKMVYGDIVHPDDIEKVRSGMEKSTEEGSSFFTQEYRIITKNEEIRWVDERTQIQHNDAGKVTYLQGIILDITERKKIETALLKEDSRHEAILALYEMKDSSIEDILASSREETLKLTDSNFGVILWFEREEDVKSYVSATENLIEQNGRIPLEITRFCEKVISNKHTYIVNDSSTLQPIEKDGMELDLKRYLGVPVFENSRVIGVAWVAGKPEKYNEADLRQLTLLMQGMWNLIQQKKSAEELRQYADEARRSNEIQKVLGEVIKNSPATVFLWRAEEEWPVEFVSENVTQFGYTVEDFLSGKLVYADIVHPYDLERVQKELAKRIDEGHTDFNQEYRIMTKFGDMRWVDERTFIKHNEKGEVAYLQGIIVDITDRKHASDFMHIQFDLDSVLSSATNAQESFDMLLELALRVEPVDSGALYLVDEATGDLNLVSHRGLSEKFVRSTTYYAKNSVQTRLVMTGQPVYKHHSELSAITTGENLQYEGLHATAVIPVQYQDMIIAALMLSSHDEYEIPDSSRYDLEVVAAQIGEVISQMRSETYMQRQLENLQYLIDDIPEALIVLDETGNIFYSNIATIAELTDGEEVIGKNFTDLVADKSINMEEIARNIAEKGVFKIKVKVVFPGNTGFLDTIFSRSTWNGKPCFIALMKFEP
ncbi:PAS domain S-box-containing protein [Methanohalophilus levihalophilus]|uniref:PAS domain-containing protein n=1 Tax=Methanohalophilus levihalophilus TaxID=1431282 RepID=UPI001FD9CD43|nr:PAS domain-containing protein [Methanohalophilus levihalophilus]MBP2029324.1 PAS domain S-box-containing protein [Methanohalophilus levihalophilus]